MELGINEMAALLRQYYQSVFKGVCYKKKWAPDNCPDCGSNNIITRLKKHPNFKGVIQWHWYCSGKCGRDDFNKTLSDFLELPRPFSPPPVFRDEAKYTSHQFAFYGIAISTPPKATIYNIEY